MATIVLGTSSPAEAGAEGPCGLCSGSGRLALWKAEERQSMPALCAACDGSGRAPGEGRGRRPGLYSGAGRDPHHVP